MARRQRHQFKFAGIPRGDNVPPAVRILFDLLDDLVNLVDGAAIGSSPIAPLRAVDAAQVAVLVRPFIPNRHAVFIEIFDIRVAAQKPEQLMDDGLEVDFLCRDERETVLQWKTHLRAEDGIRAGAGAVGLGFSVFQDMSQQIEVLNHREENLTTKYTKYTKRNSAALVFDYIFLTNSFLIIKRPVVIFA